MLASCYGFCTTPAFAGATLLRGISGFGQSGRLHQADWTDVVGDLPLVLEFVDTPEKVNAVLPSLLEQTDPNHVLTWPVQGCSRQDRS